jgi:prepilin peptidase CpaA
VNAPLWISIPIFVFVALAAFEDQRTHRIPNRITGPAFLVGLAVHLAAGGPAAMLMALVAGVVAGAILLPGWLMKFMGAGDVKLMAAIGVWLGAVGLAVEATLCSLIAGGIISLLVAARLGILPRTLRNAALLLPRTVGAGGPLAPTPDSSGVRVPKALAFLAGTLFALCWRW